MPATTAPAGRSNEALWQLWHWGVACRRSSPPLPLTMNALPCCSSPQLLGAAFFAAWTAVTAAWICSAERIAILHEMLRQATALPG